MASEFYLFRTIFHLAYMTLGDDLTWFAKGMQYDSQWNKKVIFIISRDNKCLENSFINTRERYVELQLISKSSLYAK